MYRNFFRALENQKEIKFLRANINYTTIYFKMRERVISKTLNLVMGELDQGRFCRCHRSFIVNFDHISEVDFKNNIIKIDSGEVIPISRRSRAFVRRFSKQYIMTL